VVVKHLYGDGVAQITTRIGHADFPPLAVCRDQDTELQEPATIDSLFDLSDAEAARFFSTITLLSFLFDDPHFVSFDQKAAIFALNEPQPFPRPVSIPLLTP
jgi:hypothetical protein